MTFHEMHYFKQDRQKKGWKGDFFIFEKKKFLEEFYIPNKANIPKDFFNGCKYFETALEKYIVNRNTQKIFQTKFMDIITEDSIDYELTQEEIFKNAKLSKTTLIENKFDYFLKNKKDNETFKNNNKKENLSDVVAYFALQSSRTPLNLFGWFDDFIRIHKVEYTKDYALKFREFYNKKYLDFFSLKYNHLLKNKNNILIIRMDIDFTHPNLKYYTTVGEHNTINLLQYKRMSPFIQNYPDELLNNIDMTVVDGNQIYFCIVVPPKGWKCIIEYFKNILRKHKDFPYSLYEFPREQLFYEDLLREVQSTWNNFSLFASYEYMICSSKKEYKNFIAEQLFYFHTNNELEEQHKINSHINDLLSLEKLLK